MAQLMSFVPRQLRKPEKIATEGIRKLADATLLITHAEVSVRHGTGAFLKNILGKEKQLVVLHSHSFFGRNEIGTCAYRVWHGPASLRKAVARIKEILRGITVRRILCVPFYQDEALSALAAVKLTGAPMVLYIMDDQNIHVQGISDPLMTNLVNQAQVCFAISEPLREAYQKKFKRPFWLVPPVVDPGWFVPPDHTFTPNQPPRGVLIGNLWSGSVIRRFRETIRLAGLPIDWYGNAGQPFVKLDQKKLALEGLRLHGIVPETELIAALRAADFALVPAGMLDGSDSHDWLARTSLPSRIIFLMTSANIPIVVLGHLETAAAKFVQSKGLGTVTRYDHQDFLRAVARVTIPSTREAVRKNAARIRPCFSSEGMSAWIWESARLGRPADDRFEKL
jgi:hypothetical protein